jgi:hypothetical protein
MHRQSKFFHDGNEHVGLGDVLSSAPVSIKDSPTVWQQLHPICVRGSKEDSSQGPGRVDREDWWWGRTVRIPNVQAIRISPFVEVCVAVSCFGWRRWGASHGIDAWIDSVEDRTHQNRLRVCVCVWKGFSRTR